jgi:hypothetical protein
MKSSSGLEVLPATANGMAGHADYVYPEDSTQRAMLYTEAASCTNLLYILTDCGDLPVLWQDSQEHVQTRALREIRGIL